MHAALVGMLLVLGSQTSAAPAESIGQPRGTEPVVQQQVHADYPVVTSYAGHPHSVLHTYYCRPPFDYRRSFDFPWRPYSAWGRAAWMVPRGTAARLHVPVPRESGSGVPALPGPPRPDLAPR